MLGEACNRGNCCGVRLYVWQPAPGCGRAGAGRTVAAELSHVVRQHVNQPLAHQAAQGVALAFHVDDDELHPAQAPCNSR